LIYCNDISDSNRLTLFVPDNYDSDGDGLSDAWEMQNYLQAPAPAGDDSGSSGEFFDDPTGDSDADGLTNLDEFLLGTDPEVSSAAAVPVLLYR
jgi:hypothetical protein